MMFQDKLKRGARWATRKMRLIRCILLLILLIITIDKSLALKNASHEAYRITSLPKHEYTFAIFKPGLTRPYKQKGLLTTWSFGGRQMEVIKSRAEPSIYANWPTATSFAEWVSNTEYDSLTVVCDPSCSNANQYYLLSPYQSNIDNLVVSIKHSDRIYRLIMILFIIDMIGWVL